MTDQGQRKLSDLTESEVHAIAENAVATALSRYPHLTQRDVQSAVLWGTVTAWILIAIVAAFVGPMLFGIMLAAGIGAAGS